MAPRGGIGAEIQPYILSAQDPDRDSDPVEEKPVEVVQIGTFGANEFEEALLVDMPRFQDEQRDEAMSEEETEQ